MASPFTITSVSNYNSNPPSDDGAQTAANRVQWSAQKSKLADPIKTAFDASETATSTAFGKVVGGAGITTTAVDYTVTASDQGKLVKCTVSGKTITTPDATVVGSPFVFFVLNASAGNITLDGNGTQTVDGSLNFTIPAGAGVMLNTDGSNWFTGGRNFFQAGTGISFNTATTLTTISAVLLNYLTGLTLSTAGGSGTITIAAGIAADSTNTALMNLSSSISKTTASWAVGSGNGGLDTGAIANNTWYHFYEIAKADGTAADVTFSLNATTPSLTAPYTLFRRIGSGKTDGSAHWLAFNQAGDNFIWGTPVADSNATVSGGRAAVTLTVPTGVTVAALIWGSLNASTGTSCCIDSLLRTGAAAPGTNTNTNLQAGTNSIAAGQFEIITNTSAQIAAQSATASAATLTIYTYGWKDTRGK